MTEALLLCNGLEKDCRKCFFAVFFGSADFLRGLLIFGYIYVKITVYWFSALFRPMRPAL